MSVAIEQVKHWLKLCGVGHAVAEVRSGWSYTACNKMISGDPTGTTPPRRICKRCRERLKVAELVQGGVEEGQ